MPTSSISVAQRSAAAPCPNSQLSSQDLYHRTNSLCRKGLPLKIDKDRFRGNIWPFCCESYSRPFPLPLIMKSSKPISLSCAWMRNCRSHEEVLQVIESMASLFHSVSQIFSTLISTEKKDIMNISAGVSLTQRQGCRSSVLNQSSNLNFSELDPRFGKSAEPDQ